MLSTEKLLPVTLPSWPSCDECLSWSEDGLAIAGGEFVHIITPKGSESRARTIGHPQWHLLSFRLNLFSQDEWPEQSPATIADLSIGEEQSLSLASALAWSPPGLGLYRRPVLAILTSNLLLSIWERGGGQEQYSRTCVVNNHIVSTSKSKTDRSDRRAIRIRSFVWLPPLRITAESRWGLHYLLVVDDHRNATIFQLSKLQVDSLGTWHLNFVVKFSLDDSEPLETAVETMSPLQKRLHFQSPITKINVGPWVQERVQATWNDSDLSNLETGITKAQSKITFYIGKAEHSKIVYASIPSGDEQISFSILTQSTYSPRLDDNLHNAQITENHDRSVGARVMDSPEIYFHKAIQPLTEEFDQNFRLFGNFRVRFWGSTLSIDGTRAAACITIHPSDMVEHTIPSTEKCMLVFENVKATDGQQSVTTRSDMSIQDEIIHTAYRIAEERGSLESPLDRKLFQTYCRLADVVQRQYPELRSSLEAVRTNLQVSMTSQTATNGCAEESRTLFDEHLEACEICEAGIAFTDTRIGRCSQGHQFSRCQLSFLTIQEPGISKYCSQCGKQFLDLMKLGSITGPSFAQSVFEEYDVCPYCQGKFRE